VFAWPSSIRVRLTVWYAILLGIPLAVFAIISYIAFSRALVGGTDRFIGEALAAFERELGAERRAGLGITDAMRATVHEVRFRELHILITDSSNQVIARGDSALVGTSPKAGEATLLETVRGAGPITEPYTVRLSGPDGEQLVRAQPLVLDGHRYTLSGRYPLREAERMMFGVRRMFLVAIPLLIIAAAVSGYFLADRSLKPVSSMAEHAAEITASNLHERLPVTGGDELVRLARVINDLLDRLETSFEQQRRFMADASHELRTPTAIVRTEADVTLSRPSRTTDEYRASIGIMQDAARRLTRIVDDLFLLARADAGHMVVQQSAVYLEDVVDGAVRGVRQLADTRGVAVQLRELVEAPMRGDADLLGRIVLNLLDNAIKHAPAGGSVMVGMARHGAMVTVSVVDSGPGIPAEAVDRLFERFFRAEASRPRHEDGGSGGAGLGLAIARRIAEAHGGRLELVSSRPGHTEFRLTLPIESSVEAVRA
jgi:two-component system OmpR family sensor kinase